MKNKILAAVILLLPLGLFGLFWIHPARETRTPAPTPNPSAQDNAVSNALKTASPHANAIINSNFAAPAQTVFYTPTAKPVRAPAGTPHPLEFTNFTPEIVIENMRHAIKDYGSMFGGNPVGENAEITSQLMGQNPKQANFIQPDAGMRVNSQGELVDPWGTPYFFHQLSGTEMEIHSAGPDKVMWTDDDIVIK